MEKTVSFKVYQTAFCKGPVPKIRIVKISSKILTKDEGTNLELIFKYGQNDLQLIKDCYSVSIGDIINYHNRLFLVSDIGFIEKGAVIKLTGSLALKYKFGKLDQYSLKHFGYLLNHLKK